MKTPDNTQFRNAALISARLSERGHTAYFAGGCVRDMIMQRTPKDIDIVTDATPDQISAIFPDSDLTGKAFGVVRVRMTDDEFEIATFRADHDHKDGRHPGSVSFTDEKTDSSRRDFTINSLLYDPASGRVIDHQDGSKDITLQLLRFIGDPEQRISEDHLRMLRAIRFSGTLGFRIEDISFAAIIKNAGLIEKISAERVRDELIRMLTESPKPGKALETLDASGLLAYILPEVSALKGVAHSPEKHPEGDVFTHTCRMLDHAGASGDHCLAFSALLHDIGKKDTFTLLEGKISFPCHEERGADIAENILHRLRFPKKEIQFIRQCIERHGVIHKPEALNLAELRKIAASPTFPTELKLHKLDVITAGGSDKAGKFYDNFLKSYIDREILPQPLVSGKDLLAMSMKQGPDFGRILAEAYDLQLNETLKSRDAIIDWLAKRSKQDL